MNSGCKKSQGLIARTQPNPVHETRVAAFKGAEVAGQCHSETTLLTLNVHGDQEKP